MSEATTAIKYLVDLFLKKRDRNIQLKSDVSLKFREVITEVEIYLFNIKTEEDRDQAKEQNIARLWSSLAAHCAPYDENYSDTFLKISQCWSDPKQVPITDKDEHITIIRKLLQDGRDDGVMATIAK